jgi:hypothetical protein
MEGGTAFGALLRAAVRDLDPAPRSAAAGLGSWWSQLRPHRLSIALAPLLRSAGTPGPAGGGGEARRHRLRTGVLLMELRRAPRAGGAGARPVVLKGAALAGNLDRPASSPTSTSWSPGPRSTGRRGADRLGYERPATAREAFYERHRCTA